MTQFDLKTLDNKELMIIYYRFSKYIADMEKNLEKNIIVKKVSTPMGTANAIANVSDEEKEKFLNSEYYTSIKSLVNKLEPVILLIEDCSEEMKEFATNIK